MELVITIIAFVLIFGLLIFVHELGHFIVAKRNGIKVEEFAFGLPLLPKIFGIKRGETTYAIYPVPLGGFVRMLGEDGEKGARSFASKSPKVRAKVLAAGVTMNLLLAYVLLTIGFLFNMPPLALCASSYPGATFEDNVKLVTVSDGPAKAAGLQENDVIRNIGGQSITCARDVSRLLKPSAGTPITISAERNGQPLEVSVTPRGKNEAQAGTIGVAPLDDYAKLNYPWWTAPYLALLETGAIAATTVSAIGGVFTNLFTHATVPAGVSGPVGIAKLTGEVVGLGAIIILRFVAILSLSLAVFNLLPIPALDGGRLFFVFVEMLRGGKTITPRVENAIHAAGFVFLIGFIIVITYFDITR